MYHNVLVSTVHGDEYKMNGDK
uniref:Uncharacterized protein n=1 Tax=Anguilla anguilla TaxID=7936 RepID=A0A0E9VII0_ANGAN